MTLPPERDFKLIIAEIEASGVTLYKLSLMIGKQLHLVRRWKFGAKPKHHEGEALLSIHAEYCIKSYSSGTLQGK